MKVGDYIHFRYSNYRRYGLSIDGSKGSSGMYKALADQKKVFQQLLTDRGTDKKAIKEKLEQQINFFYDIKNSAIQFGYDENDAQRLEQIIIQAVEQAISSLKINLNRASINWDNASARGGGSVTVGDQSYEFAKLRKTIIGGLNSGGKLKTRSTYSAVYRRVCELKALRDSLVGSGGGRYDQEFIQKMNELENKYQQTLNDLEAETNGQVITGYTMKGQTGTGSKIFYLNQNSKDKNLTNQDFVTELNDLLDMTKQTTDTQIAGYLGEYLPAISQIVAEQLAEKGLDELLSEVDQNSNYVFDLINGKVVGNKLSRKTVMSSNIINKKEMSDSVEASIGGVKINTSYTKDKVDIVLDLDNQTTINASAKNVALANGHNIGILSGTSSLALIQDYPDFANHYLNITANIGRPDSSPEGMLMQAHNIMKQTIALHALVGGVWGQDHKTGEFKKNDIAEILVVNDSSSKYGRFKVYFMLDILDTISRNIDLIQIESEGHNEPFEFENEWVDPVNKPKVTSAWARVSNIMAQLHTQKLKVSLSSKALS